MKKISLILLFLVFSFRSWSQEFPINIFTAEYYYTFLTSNLSYKLQKLHDHFSNRRLTSYWQYAVSDKCETLYSHAIIPQIISHKDKLVILMNLTECGTPIVWFQFEYELGKVPLSAQELSVIKKNLVLFKFPDLNWERYKSIKISGEHDTFFWTENTLFVRSLQEYNTYEIKLTHSHNLINSVQQNYLKLEFYRLRSEHQMNAQFLSVAYQPASEDHFPTITYYNAEGKKISAKIFLEEYKHYFSSTLNEFVLEFTEITTNTFGVSEQIIIHSH